MTKVRGADAPAWANSPSIDQISWAYSPYGDETISEMLGRTDEDILPVSERDAEIALKRQVLSTGKPADGEAFYCMPRGRALLFLDAEPTRSLDGRIVGLTCAAIDISHLRLLESEQRRLTAELRTALARYDIALRGSHVTVFTQDRSLRYTSVSNPTFGCKEDEIIGRTDEETFGLQEQRQLIGLHQIGLQSLLHHIDEDGIGQVTRARTLVRQPFG